MNIFNQKSTPDIIIPFVMQVQLGLLAQLEQFREKPSSMSKLEKQKLSSQYHGEKGAALSMRQCFADKDALFSGIDLSLQYLPSSITAPKGNTKSMHQNATSSSTTQIDNFVTLSLTNFPIKNSSRDDFSKPKEITATKPSEQLIMESQLNKGSLADLFQNRRKNVKTMENFLEALTDNRSFEHPQHIGAVEINATNASDSFHILVDGTLYGPFRRLIIRSCTAEDGDNGAKRDTNDASNDGLTLPIVTYMPLDV
jgi:hypothetical protein